MSSAVVDGLDRFRLVKVGVIDAAAGEAVDDPSVEPCGKVAVDRWASGEDGVVDHPASQ